MTTAMKQNPGRSDMIIFARLAFLCSNDLVVNFLIKIEILSPAENSPDNGATTIIRREENSDQNGDSDEKKSIHEIQVLIELNFAIFQTEIYRKLYLSIQALKKAAAADKPRRRSPRNTAEAKEASSKCSRSLNWREVNGMGEDLCDKLPEQDKALAALILAEINRKLRATSWRV